MNPLQDLYGLSARWCGFPVGILRWGQGGPLAAHEPDHRGVRDARQKSPWATCARSRRRRGHARGGRLVWTAEGRRRATGLGGAGFDVTDDHPAACINWDEAMGYIDWLNTQDARRVAARVGGRVRIRREGTLDQQYPWPGGLSAICNG
ncbi:hypothetical protein [Marivita cryptomonadis]|uniref:hypothetical protein n=1 Tax=Marivita cryptomonadis TaxID=505252 RepID=UPI00391BF2B3